MLASSLVENNFNKNNSKESIAKLKIKEYFSINETLTHDKFNNFLEFIGLKEIWSTEIEQNLLWETLVAISKDKKSIDYDSALRGISTFFDEDDGKDITDIYDENIYNINLKDVSLEESDNINLFDNKKNVDNEKYIDEFLNTIHNKQDTLYNIRFINEIFFRKYFNKNNIIDNDKNENEIIINLDEIVETIKNRYLASIEASHTLGVTPVTLLKMVLKADALRKPLFFATSLCLASRCIRIYCSA